jgi:hypothetical protein
MVSARREITTAIIRCGPSVELAVVIPADAHTR